MSELVVALDYPGQREALELVDDLEGTVDFFKVGLQLYTREGPGVVRALKGRGHRVFLDLKLLDIPNTVARAVASAATLGVDLLTVHAQGGPTMLREAADAAGEELDVVAVTVLTSLAGHELGEIWGRPIAAVEDEVIRLARMAQEAGISGVVASALEAGILRSALGDDFLVVTPGIRLPGGATHDQARVTTPDAAVSAGASHLVVGRAITAAADPAAAARRVREAMDKARA